MTAKYIIHGDCWLWVGATTGGHPCVKHGGRTVMVRRLLWTRQNGELQTGQQLQLVCEHDNCVNPDHCKIRRPKPRRIPRKPRAVRREERVEMYMLRGCEKREVIAAMYGVRADHVSRVHTLGRIGEL